MARPAAPARSGQLAWARGLYVLLVALRMAAVSFPGYIHPDEHFQNAQIGARVLGLQPAYATWEWAPELPSRSIVGPGSSTGLAFWLLGQLAERGYLALSTRSLLVASRLPFLAGSFLVDWLMWTGNLGAASRWTGLLLWASSWPALVFMLRPFGNAYITLLYTGCLLRVLALFDGRPFGALSAALLGALGAWGLFVHFTLVFFLAPLCLLVPAGLWRAGATAASLARCVAAGLAGAAAAGAACVVVDNLYYGRLAAASLPQLLVDPALWAGLELTPLNLIRYNLNMENLGQHGLHPWYLHVAVNMFLMLGPLYAHWLASNLLATGLPEKLFFGLLVGLPLAGLSTSPHQEARYVLPLAVPVILQCARHVRSRWFFGAWLLFNTAMVVLFGQLHQAGVVRAIAAVSARQERCSVYFYKTYMPPRYLFASREAGLYTVPELVGLGPAEVRAAIAADPAATRYLVAAPALARDIRPGLEEVGRVWPHLSLDNLEVFDVRRLADSLSLGIYRL